MSDFDMNIPAPIGIYKKDLHGVKNFPVGGSKFFPSEDTNRKRVLVMAAANSSNPNAKFISRSVVENDVKGVRVWRIE